jgi:Amt family ammonium transporter
MYFFFKISNKITPIRVPAEAEEAGLDIPEMGVHGYVD